MADRKSSKPPASRKRATRREASKKKNVPPPPEEIAPAESSDEPGATSALDFTETDTYLFREGTHGRLYEKLGAIPTRRDGADGTLFRVWAPAARSVSVIGDFNEWSPKADPMRSLGEPGVWECFVEGASRGDRYKFRVKDADRGRAGDKADPFATAAELPPRTASVIHTSEYSWNDDEWMEKRGPRLERDAPISIYEMHPGSWRRNADGSPLGWSDLAEELVPYLTELGFTHLELLPVTEHPFYGSWGYQTTGYFAPTSRYGSPDDFRRFVDRLHQGGIGVILDWVPSHFPTDAHGLGFFDGTHLYEHADPRLGFHPDWNSFIFNYGRGEVRSFLLSSALYWLHEFHIDGIRVDAVASMLYLDYSREGGNWIPNRYGGRENLDAIHFLRTLNEAVYREVPGVQTIAEESTAWPMVSRPTWLGGLGFGYKWDMGWMHDTLGYMSRDPIHRRFHHNELTFRAMYAWSENYVLPLSHDEVVHGKGSLLRKMPGDEWQRFANLRALYSMMWTQPGKKLLFMGCEIGQWAEWNHDAQLSWPDANDSYRNGLLRFVGKLNTMMREQKALHELDSEPSGFEWIDANDALNSVLSYARKDRDGNRLICVINLTPEPRPEYLLGCPDPGSWRVILNSDEKDLGGSGYPIRTEIESAPIAAHGRYHALLLDLPPLGALVLEKV
ncbi:MAG: 1,4-alpha-glucan branching protein GlgB [Acidobacteria bacterium]|nr:1,4-alpha-glucan branching protein GlgB [Acidobacteriota bacterium]